MLVSYFHFIIKRLSCLIIVGPVTGFPFEYIAVNHFYSTLYSCANSSSFNVYHLKSSCIL